MAEKCKACGGRGATGPAKGTDDLLFCYRCHGTGVEPTACGHGMGPSAIDVVCRVTEERETLSSRLAAAEAIAAELAYLVEHVHGDIGIDWSRRRAAVLKRWREVGRNG